MNKNTIIGFSLILLIVLGWMWWTQPSEEEQKRMQEQRDSIQVANQKRADSLAALEMLFDHVEETAMQANSLLDSIATVSEKDKKLLETFGVFSNAADQEESFYTLENEVYKITFSNKGGRIHKVELKDYKRFDSLPLVIFDPETADFSLEFFSQNKPITTGQLYFEPIWYNTPENNNMKLENADSMSFGMRLYVNNDDFSPNKDKYIEFLYTIHKNEYMMGFDVSFHNMQNDIMAHAGSINLLWKEDLNRNEQHLKGEREKTTLYYKIHQDDVEKLSERKEEEREKLLTKLDWVSFKSRFFLSTLIAVGRPFEEAIVEKSTDEKRKENGIYLQSMNVSIAMPWDAHNADYSFPMKFYYGPNKYKTLRSYDMSLEKQVPLGGWIIAWINKGVVWTFDVMDSWNWNYGIIILVLAILIKIILFPLTMKSYRSQAVMRVLKPEIDEISQRYPNKEDAMKKQQATMALYKQAGVNPMGGCLPMLLQFPILIAMFNFFPSSIELRQQSFLWAHDLSSYDSIWNMPFNIPFYGDHVSLFTLLMTISTVIYTYSNMKNSMSTNQMPGMKMMMYVMPVMFMGIFNNYAAALSYYYLVINLLTFLQTYIMRLITDDEAIHAKIKANKSKPVKKKGGFMQRLEEYSKQQQQKTKPVQKPKQNPKKK